MGNMGSFAYLFKRTMVNRIKKALKKPLTYVFIIFILIYVVSLIGTVGMWVDEFKIDTSENFAIIMSIVVIYLLPGNFIAYTKRKGMLFKKSDIHFIFPAPVSPKQVLLFTGIKNLLINAILALLAAIIGCAFFHTGVVLAIIYAILFFVFENVLEASMMILCYGNETVPDRVFKILTIVCYAFMAVITLTAIFMLYQNGASFGIIRDYLSLTIIQIIPVIGWNIAMIRLIFVGPTVLNVICTILFCIFTVVMFILARRSKCVGEYYEDAAKFADDYAELKEKQNKGIMSTGLGKKKKFKEAEVTYKGHGAKAIFYRQLLEYKKSKFFIFGFNTLISLVVGIGIAVFTVLGMEEMTGNMRIFIIPGVMAYVVFIFGAYSTKWSQELENPYTFLIPDSSFKKLWYSTQMEHIRAIIDGVLMTVPGAIAMKLSLVQTILIILLYICLMANKLYYYMLADMLVGKYLGATGRQLVKLLFQGIAISIGIVAAVLGGILLGVEAGFIIMIVAMILFTLIGAIGAAASFEKMEVME